jgi:steroid delta-isomerase-like uncharacterized protein
LSGEVKESAITTISGVSGKKTILFPPKNHPGRRVYWEAKSGILYEIGNGYPCRKISTPEKKENSMSVQVASDIRVFIQEYFDAWEESKVDKILAYFSEDVVIDLLGGPALLEGKKAVADNFVAPFTTAFPGMLHNMRNYIQHGNQVVVEWLFTAVHSGNYGPFAPTGRKIELPGCSVYTIENGKITRGNLYFNGPTLIEQVKGA